MKQVLLTLGAIVCLCVAILSSGIVLCMSAPQITQNLSRATALVDTAHFSRDQLVNLADKTRGFCAGEVEKQEIYDTVQHMNQEANTQYKDLIGSDFAAVNDEYSLDQNALSHLEDVRSFFANVRIAFGICCVGALAFCILLFVFCGRSAFGRALMWSGLIILIAIVAVVVWAISDFNGMFNYMHSMFFAENS